MNNKAVTFGAIALAMTTLVVVGGSLAYFSDSESAGNVLTVGDVSIKLEEPLWNSAQQHILSPGVHIDKNPTVTNIGSNDVYVRVKIKIDNFNIMKYIVPSFSLGAKSGSIEGFQADKWTISNESTSSDGSEHTAELIYKDKLFCDEARGKTSAVVFTGLNIPSQLNFELKHSGEIHPNISVAAQAIQAQGFKDAITAFESFDNQVIK